MNTTLMQDTTHEQRQEKYIAGVCNIGGEEVQWRRLWGFINSGLTILLTAALIGFHLPHAWRWLTAIPAFLGSLGFLQAGVHFCAGYGLRGRANVAGSIASRTRIEQREFRRQDITRSFQIILAAAFIASSYATAFFISPW